MQNKLSRFTAIWNEVWVAAEMLHVHDSDAYDRDLKKQLRQTLSAMGTPSNPDVLGGEVNALVADLKAKLGPYLRLTSRS